MPKGDRRDVVFEIKGPKVDVIDSGLCMANDSVSGFTWEIPETQAGGQYTLRVRDRKSRTGYAERTFDVRAYRAPRLKSQIKFLRDGYGAGDEVVAMLSVERAEGGFPSGAKVTVTTRVDGAQVFKGSAKIDDKWNCASRFKLPTAIQRGEGTIAMAIEDGGVIETATKTIPILLQTVDLTFYPEGGELLGGCENRVYFEAFTPVGKPADLAGSVFDQDGNEVAQFRSEHEGRGRFSFTPDPANKYVVLYWRMLESKQQVELPISLLAAVPGSYTGPASRTYLYYTDEHKRWVEALKVEVQPKGELAMKISN